MISRLLRGSHLPVAERENEVIRERSNEGFEHVGWSAWEQLPGPRLDQAREQYESVRENENMIFHETTITNPGREIWHCRVSSCAVGKPCKTEIDPRNRHSDAPAAIDEDSK
jgi:hypothetical protein